MRTSALALALAAAAWLASASMAGEPVNSFLLPGVDPSDIRLEPGRWCRYVVVDEADGLVDSTSFYVAILTAAGDGDYWVELETGPVGIPPAEREVTKALIAAGIQNYVYGDSLYRYVRELYIRKGSELAQQADPVDLKRVTLATPTSDKDWTRHSGVTVPTPKGPIICNQKEMTVEDVRRIPTGRVTLVRNNVDRFRVWSSTDVPVFSLVKCVIERSRESKTVPAVPGIPNAGARESKTTVLLVDYGTDARPLLDVP